MTKPPTKPEKNDTPGTVPVEELIGHPVKVPGMPVPPQPPPPVEPPIPPPPIPTTPLSVPLPGVPLAPSLPGSIPGQPTAPNPPHNPNKGPRLLDPIQGSNLHIAHLEFSLAKKDVLISELIVKEKQTKLATLLKDYKISEGWDFSRLEDGTYRVAPK